MKYTENVLQIEKTINDYFEGIFYGDVPRLKAAFSDKAYLWGDIRGAEYQKSLYDYLEGVKNRKSPSEMGEEYNMKILAIEVLGNVAVAKLHVPMLGFNYYDFLSLCLIDEEWKIVNKLFTHVEYNKCNPNTRD